MWDSVVVTLSYEHLYSDYMAHAGKGRQPPDKSTAAIMESILEVEAQKKGCLIMWDSLVVTLLQRVSVLEIYIFVEHSVWCIPTIASVVTVIPKQ